MSKKKILLIDCNNMFFRSYCASPTLGTKGNHVGGITGFLYSLQKRIKDIDPHQVFLIWDGRGGSKKRKEIREDYKDGRKVPKPLRLNRAHDLQLSEDDEKQSLYYQQSVLIELLNNFPYMQICEPGIEADDFISFLSSYFTHEDGFVNIIVSNDKDFIQLTNECTLLYRPADESYHSYKDILEKEGIHPKNMALSRAIEGDNADNLTGVRGVGRKTIVKKYPELKEARTIPLDEFKKILESKEKCNTSAAILADFEKVGKNYEIMQLYMPMINALAAIKIREELLSYKPVYDLNNIKRILSEEGIVNMSLKGMYDHSLKIIKEQKYE
jgi:DNA polymerase-1